MTRFSARLRALDDRVLPAGRWYDRNVRYWWVFLVAAAFAVGVTPFLDGPEGVPLLLLGLQSAFQGGWFYHERCRTRGVGPRWRALHRPAPPPTPEP